MAKQAIKYVLLGGVLVLGQSVYSSELVYRFNSPSFNGINQSAHYLTIDEQERTRAEDLAKEIQDELDEAEREADNTVLSKFIRNLESRIYSTLAKDLSESLFNYDGIPSAETPITGEINLEGNILRWVNEVCSLGNFGGCWTECDAP